MTLSITPFPVSGLQLCSHHSPRSREHDVARPCPASPRSLKCVQILCALQQVTQAAQGLAWGCFGHGASAPFSQSSIHCPLLTVLGHLQTMPWGLPLVPAHISLAVCPKVPPGAASWPVYLLALSECLGVWETFWSLCPGSDARTGEAFIPCLLYKFFGFILFKCSYGQNQNDTDGHMESRPHTCSLPCPLRSGWPRPLSLNLLVFLNPK